MRASHPAEGRKGRSRRPPKSLAVEERREKLGSLDGEVLAERWWGISGRSQEDMGGIEVYLRPTLGVPTEDSGYRKKSRGLLA